MAHEENRTAFELHAMHHEGWTSNLAEFKLNKFRIGMLKTLNEFDDEGNIIIPRDYESDEQARARHELEKQNNKRYALNSARTEVTPLTGVQEYAIDLYKRGFNVFPIPSAHDWNLRGEEKKPYKLEPLYRNRLHYLKDCQCSACDKYNFLTLFENSNLAIMCGVTSGNLLSVDCDSKAAYDFIGAELARYGLVFPHVWTFKSGRGGGHYLLRISEGEAANIPQEQSKFDDVQVWARLHFIIVPPSIHPNGTLYEWQTPEPLTMLPYDTLPAVSVAALEWLGVKLKKFSKSENEDDVNGLPEYAKNLSHTSRHTLKNGAKDGGRNSALCALAADLVGIGLDEDETESALQTAADYCDPPYPSNENDTSLEDIVTWAFSQERTPTRSYQSKIHTDAVQDWQRAQAFAMAYDWRNAFGGLSSYARRVYLACIERARLDSRSKVFRAAAREIGKHAAMNKDTAARYMRLLAGKNYDRKGKPLFKNVNAEPLLEWRGEEKSGAYKFSFVFLGEGVNAIPVQYKDIDILLSENCTTQNNTLPNTDAEANAFHGLGVYAFGIWRGLLVRPAKSLYELAKRLSVSPHTVKATVTRLVSAGLVVFSQSEGLYIANQLTDAQLAIVAADRGTQNKAQEKRERFTLEREKHANKLVFEAKNWYKKNS